MAAHDHARVIVLAPLILLGTAMTGRLLQWLWPLPLFAPPGGALLGWTLIIAALVVTAWSMLRFQRVGTTVNPYRGSTQLVMAGPYRYSRNPMYASLLVIQAALVLTTHICWELLMILPNWLLLRYGVIAPEERYLEQKFGEDYRRYLLSVRRWI
jgi:protein-S-isoprenylcysteine O-methyltransferase Ste14